MKKFTYRHFMKYHQYIENIDYFQNVLKEDGERYEYKKININYKHDKIFREILEDKKEVVAFINKILKIENKKQALKEEDIEKYNRKFVTTNFRYAETDIIYRKKGEDIFFLIEHQSTVDYSMPYRILMYSLEIMKSVIDERMLRKKGYKFPMIYPIILYTGTKTWNVEKYIEERQQKIPGCEPVKFYEYNIVDINQYTEEELLESEMFLPKLMLLEKSKSSQKMIETLNKVIEKKLTEKNKDFLKRIIYYILRDEIDKEEAEDLLKKLKIEKGGDNMFIEILRKEVMQELEKIEGFEKFKKIKEFRERELKEGREEGKRIGIEEGKKVGIEEGKKVGIEEGKKVGIEEGKKVGIEEGKKVGIEEGKKVGIEEGKKVGIEEGKKVGIEEGKRIGIEQGKKEGREKALKMMKQDMKIQWIKKMLKNNINEKDILKVSGISKEELEKIKNTINERAS